MVTDCLFKFNNNSKICQINLLSGKFLIGLLKYTLNEKNNKNYIKFDFLIKLDTKF